eukprot:gnl/Dysnectes_brevis/2450_a2920_1653.p1 GENE.gnl/Dysnectes_brevis/2450_a2920_1653~~gnl/Dysnectes_brevis/2450_a2920_1653.p1  ORF type:complete len:882 (-),score=397.14 gnl/Dysnectes_brevis/2450_a2920_1653:80-2725(-)
MLSSSLGDITKPRSVSKRHTSSHVGSKEATPGQSIGSHTFISLLDRDFEVKKEQVERSMVSYIKYNLGRDSKTIDVFGMYQATSMSLRSKLIDNFHKTMKAINARSSKCVAYLSLEYLMGRALTNTLYNLEVTSTYHEALRNLGFELEQIQAEESDAALGNGGLGRLAACYIDSSATMELPVWGYGLRYQYGMFKQRIENGFQVEEPDYWLRHGTPFPEVERLDIEYVVRFYGHTKSDPVPGQTQSRSWSWEGGELVKAIAYDCLCPGHNTRNVANIRLWSARPYTEFQLHSHVSGDFYNAVRAKAESENITFVLYPNDHTESGRVLRLKQEYFFSSASLQDIIHRATVRGIPLLKLGEFFAVQLNDTHPAIAIPELMRLLLDDHAYEWVDAWNVCQKVFSYTNHTVLPEALERWPLHMIQNLLPRHAEIILEINRRFMGIVSASYPGDVDRLRRMSIIEEGATQMVRMAYLSIVGSHHVNGVAALHTEIIKESIFKDFHQLWPTKIVNITNGVTPRRWIAQCNPKLAAWITKRLKGMGLIRHEHEWVSDMSLLRNLETLAEDGDALDQLLAIKHHNKERLAAYIKENCGVVVNPNMIFDTQVKRIHEYKRQLLNILATVHFYLRIKDMTPQERVKHVVPVCKIFAGKAAVGYDTAKRIIKLITAIGDVVNKDPETRDFLKVVYIADYCCSNAEIIFPGTEVSEQVSTAGHEASGTGNMKAVMNGGVIIGTLDGANVEIREHIGEENMFVFGATKSEVIGIRDNYNRGHREDICPELIAVLDTIDGGLFGHQELFLPLTGQIRSGSDFYLVAHDFPSYVECSLALGDAYLQKDEWARQMLFCITRMAYFSSDRSIMDYANKVWDVKPVPATGLGLSRAHKM